MPAIYSIASYDIVDPLRYERSYVPALRQILDATEGEVIIAMGSAVTIEGVAPVSPEATAAHEWGHTQLAARAATAEADVSDA